MTIVPRETDALNALVQLSQRTSALERGCGDGPATEATPPTTDDEPNSSGDLGDVGPGGEVLPPEPGAKTDVKLEIVPRGVGTKRKSGRLAYPHGGLYPLYGAKKKNWLDGKGVVEATNAADKVTLYARVKTRAVREVKAGAWSTLFHLPPGWWPTTEVRGKAKTALGGLGTQVLIPVRVTTSGHVQARGPFHHPTTSKNGPGRAIRALDVRGITFAGGGGKCPGSPVKDPTAAGDGRSWEFCDDGIGEDIDPTLEPGDVGGAGGKTARFYVTGGNLKVRTGHFLPYVASSGDMGAAMEANDEGLVELVKWDREGPPVGTAFKVLADGVYMVESFLYVAPGHPDEKEITSAVDFAAPAGEFIGLDDMVIETRKMLGVHGVVVTTTRRMKAGSFIAAHLEWSFGGEITVIANPGYLGSALSITRLG